MEDINVDIPSSRVEEILRSKIDGTTYDRPPLSRVEALLMQLDTSGESTDYNKLQNKPSINDQVLIGNKTTEELFDWNET